MAEDTPNRELTLALIPPPEADFEDINRFAISYPGYSVWGDLDACWGTGKRDWDRVENGERTPASMTKLRTALFAAARAMHMGSEGDDEERFGPGMRRFTQAIGEMARGGPAGHLTVAHALARTAERLASAEGKVDERALRIELGTALGDLLQDPVASSATGHEETFSSLPFWSDSDPPGPFDVLVGPPTMPRMAAEVKWSKRNTMSHTLWDILKLLAVLSLSAEQVYLIAGYPQRVWDSAEFANLYKDGVVDYTALPIEKEWPSLVGESKGTPSRIPNAAEVTEVSRVALVHAGEPWQLRAVAIDPAPGGWLELVDGTLGSAEPLGSD